MPLLAAPGTFSWLLCALTSQMWLLALMPMSHENRATSGTKYFRPPTRKLSVRGNVVVLLSPGCFKKQDRLKNKTIS